MGDSVTLRALGYRSGQAVVVLVLAILGITACVFGLFYERAVEAAQLHATLHSSSVVARGLTVRAAASSAAAAPTGLLPSKRLGRYYRAGVRATELTVAYTENGYPIVGRIDSRTDLCAHLHLVAGRCPSGSGEVVASTSSADVLHLSAGDRIAVSGVGLKGLPPPPPLRPFALTVVGLYPPFNAEDDYWFSHQFSSTSGISGGHNPLGPVYSADTLFAREGFVQDLRAYLPADARKSVVQSVDLPLRTDRITLDSLPTLRTGLTALIAADQSPPANALAQTSLFTLLDQVDAGRRQARTVIPVFAAELELLVFVVLGIVVVAIADQQHKETALARLRGRSVSRAALLLDSQLGALILLAALPGVVLGWQLCALACRSWLSGRAQPEWRWPVMAAAVGATGLELLIVAAVARRTASRPVHELLRRIPQRTSRRGVSTAEAALATGALSGIVALLSGARNNALAVLTPGLIALVVGLALSRVLTRLAQSGGRRALWRGHLARGLAGLQIARMRGTRRVVLVVCVATALIVSAVDQWSVAARNRSVRAGVEVGAPVILTVRADSAARLQQAVAAADPSEHYATPVIRQVPPNGPPVIAVQPASFARIAGWGWPQDRPSPADLARLNPARPGPITVRGTALELQLRDLTITRQRAEGFAGRARPVFLVLNLVRADGVAVSARVGPLPEGTNRAARLPTSVRCNTGCRLSQIVLQHPTSDTDTITVDGQISGLLAGDRGDLHPVSLGKAADWGTATSDSPGTNGTVQRIRLTDAGATLRLRITNSTATAIVQHLDVPLTAPTITAGAIGFAADNDGNMSDDNIDGRSATFTPVGTLPLIPGSGGPALLVDLDIARQLAGPGLAGSTLAVWLASDDPTREHVLTATLAQHGVDVTSRDTAARRRAELAASAPAWAMQLALVSTALAVLIAALVLVLAGTTSLRCRTYDAATMALAGVKRGTLRRATLIEQMAAAAIAVLGGAAVGVVGAHLSLPSIPIFVQTAPVPAVLLPTAWSSVTLVALATLVMLCIASAVMAWALTRRIDPARLRESQR